MLECGGDQKRFWFCAENMVTKAINIKYPQISKVDIHLHNECCDGDAELLLDHSSGHLIETLIVGNQGQLPQGLTSKLKPEK
jgi:hypothetical protein